MLRLPERKRKANNDITHLKKENTQANNAPLISKLKVDKVIPQTDFDG